MRKAWPVLLLLLPGCCPSPAPHGESSLERESRLWLEQGKNPGPGNLAVTVDRIYYDGSQAGEINLLWRYVGRNVDLGNWGRAGEARQGFSAQLQALERAGRTKGKDSLFVTAAPGLPAEIFLGQEESFTPFVFRGRLLGANWEKRRVGASLAVRATPTPDGLVSLELTPRFSRLDSDEKLSVEEARTTVLAKPGAPLVLGGLDSSSSTLEGHLFGVSSKEGVKSTLLVLTLEVGK